MTPGGARTSAPGEDGVLERFLAEMVADDYPTPGTPPDVSRARPVGGRLLSATVLALIGVLIVVAVISTRSSDAQRQSTRAALAERVSTLSSSVDAKQAQVDEQTAAVDALREQVLTAGDAQSLTDATDALAASAAAAPLSGPGITVTVDDAADAGVDSLNRVLDRDLQDIVNALWRGGAAGIAVNDERLMATTAIRSAGEAILVNFQPLTRPYRITAVAPVDGSIDTTGATALLSGLTADYGLVADLAAGDVALPAGTVRPLRFATPQEGSTEP